MVNKKTGQKVPKKHTDSLKKLIKKPVPKKKAPPKKKKKDK